MFGSLPDPQERSAAAMRGRDIDPAFAPQFFILDPATNTVRCPNGKTLEYAKRTRKRANLYRRYQAQTVDFAACPSRSQCCPTQPRADWFPF